jgi:hypothetical protein
MGAGVELAAVEFATLEFVPLELATLELVATVVVALRACVWIRACVGSGNGLERSVVPGERVALRGVIIRHVKKPRSDRRLVAACAQSSTARSTRDIRRSAHPDPARIAPTEVVRSGEDRAEEPSRSRGELAIRNSKL